MSTFFKAPYGRHEVTSVLPDAQFLNGRASEASVQIKRSMLGRLLTYKRSSDWEVLRLRFIVSRMKDIELSQFIQAFHTHDWELELHDATVWQAKLIGEPIRQRGVSRRGENLATGNEDYELIFTFSAKKIT